MWIIRWILEPSWKIWECYAEETEVCYEIISWE